MHRLNRVHVLTIGDSTSAEGVETFHTGADLEELAATYNAKIHEAPVVLGHDSDPDWTKLMHRDDTGPAYGWVVGAYKDGNDLYFDLDASDELKEFIDKKRYKKRSVGYYGRTSKSNPTPGKLYIRHLAMLGASPPAIKGLDDVTLAENKMPEKNILQEEKPAEDKEKETKAPSQEETKALLDKNAEQWLAFILKDGGNIVRENIIAFDPKPAEENGWLYNIEENKWAGAFVTDDDERYEFEISEQGQSEDGTPEFVVSVKADEATIAKDAGEEPPAPEAAPAPAAEAAPAEAPAAEDEQELTEQKQQFTEETKMPNIKKEKTITEREYADVMNNEGELEMPKQTMTEEEKMKYRDDGYVDPNEAAAGTDTPRSEVDAVKDTQMAEEEVPAPEAEGEVSPDVAVEEETPDEEIIAGEMQYADEDVAAMKEELEMLRAKVKQQEEEEVKAREEEMIKFSEAVYDSGKILESQFPKEDLANLLTGLLHMKNEHMIYGEGDNQKNVLDVVKNLVDSLPEQVKLSESQVMAKPKLSAVKYDPNFSKGSSERREKILAIMDERQIPRTDMRQYISINQELTQKEGHYEK